MPPMADHQRIHPVHNELEDLSGSDKDEPPATTRRSRYCYKRSRLLRTVYVLTLLSITILATLGMTFLVVRPKKPSFSVHDVRMTQFDLGDDDTVSATFSARIKVVNPNERIGVQYLGGSSVSAWYRGQRLSEASLPEFYQGHRSTRVVRLRMRGRSGNATALLASLVGAAGVIPVEVRAELPLRVKVGPLKLPEVKFLASCELEIDDEMAPLITIANSRCNFGVGL